MTLNAKQKRIIAVIPLFILVYLGATLLLYDLILEPKVNKISGAAVSTVNVSRGAQNNCNFAIYEGKNLISFHCISGFYPINFLLNDLNTTYDSMFGYNVLDTTDPWKSYNPSLPNWTIQDLSLVESDKGYWLVMRENRLYYFEGILNSHPGTSLYKGWNLIGYPKQTAIAPQIAFASIEDKYNLILQYKKATDTWYYYIPNDNSSTLILIEPDYGYWINITEDVTWSYS